jgi:predicted O-methyltransferase YrrM
MNSIIEEIYRTGVVRDRFNNEYELHSSIDRIEGEFIFQLIKSEPDICKTLEIGCAYGLSSLFICSALSERKSARHIMIDPLQQELWNDVGVSNLQRSGFDFFELIEEGSEFILPKMAQNESGTFDLVFVDGWHTFDHTLLDLFYANLLLRKDGYLVIDDCSLPSVAKAVSYISKYPSYQIAQECPPRTEFRRALRNIITTVIPQSISGYVVPKILYDKYYIRTLFSRMVALKKVEEDERDWDWFISF